MPGTPGAVGRGKTDKQTLGAFAERERRGGIGREAVGIEPTGNCGGGDRARRALILIGSAGEELHVDATLVAVIASGFEPEIEVAGEVGGEFDDELGAERDGCALALLTALIIFE